MNNFSLKSTWNDCNIEETTNEIVCIFQLFDVEIKYGLLQLCEGLTFLHDSVKLLHRNVSPESIILNHQGAWKIFGFDFCLLNTAGHGVTPNWDFPLNDAMASDPLR